MIVLLRFSLAKSKKEKKNILGHKNMHRKYDFFDAKFECLLKGVKIHLPSVL